jgi:hypothetical protein
MNEEQFVRFLTQAKHAKMAKKQAAVLAIVDQHEGMVHRADEDGDRLLHWASMGGHVNLMRGVIDRGAVVNAKNSCGSDALMWATLNGHIPAATLLLDHGADLNARDNDGWNALMIAACKDKIDCAVFLLNRGVDLLAVDNDGKTALDHYGADSSISQKTKNKRRKILLSAFAKGPHPSQVQRRKDECWSRRRALMLVVAQNNFRPLAARRLEQEMARASLDPVVDADADAEVSPPVVLNTPEKRRAHYMGQVLSNEGLLRLVVSFL